MKVSLMNAASDIEGKGKAKKQNRTFNKSVKPLAQEGVMYGFHTNLACRRMIAGKSDALGSQYVKGKSSYKK
jgi:hypothetical protein